MSSAVHNLQKQIVSGKTPLTQLLRETKLVAAKLSLEDVEKWVDYELNGYPKNLELPKYRKIVSSYLEVLHPNRGWIRGGHLRKEFPIFEPISQIERALRKDLVAIPPEPQISFTDPNDSSRVVNWPQQLVFAGFQFNRIVDAVTNELLQWTIELEKRGIKGEDMDFDEKEKQIASHQTFNIQKFTGVLGNVTNSQVTLYDFSSIEQILKDHEIPKPDRRELEDIMDELKEASPDKKPPLLKRGEKWLVKHKEALGVATEIVAKAIGAVTK